MMPEIDEIFQRGLQSIKAQLRDEKERLRLIENEIERLKSLKNSHEQCKRIIAELETTLNIYEPEMSVEPSEGK